MVMGNGGHGAAVFVTSLIIFRISMVVQEDEPRLISVTESLRRRLSKQASMNFSVLSPTNMGLKSSASISELVYDFFSSLPL